MRYDHYDNEGQFISGPHEVFSIYIKKLTSCGNPDLLDLSLYGLVEHVDTVPEPVPLYIPTSVTMRQARLQLLAGGVYAAVNNAVATMSEAAQIEWEYAVTVDRENTLTQQMIALLCWTESQADDYFTAASLL